MMGMQHIPKMYAHGTTLAACVDQEEIIVMERTDEAVWLRFVGEDAVWPLGWAAFLSGRFVQFNDEDMEDVQWLG
jgi:hypothetical protein